MRKIYTPEPLGVPVACPQIHRDHMDIVFPRARLPCVLSAFSYFWPHSHIRHRNVLRLQDII